MASYSSPTTTQIGNWTGVSRDILGLSASAFDTLLAEFRTNAEAVVALHVGEDSFDASSLTARQVTALQQAVAYGAAAALLRAPQVQDATGTEQPLLAEFDSISEAIQQFEARRVELCELLTVGRGSAQAGISTSLSDTTEEQRVFTRDIVW